MSGPITVLVSTPTSPVFLALIAHFPGRPWLSPGSCSERERLSRHPQGSLGRIYSAGFSFLWQRRPRIVLPIFKVGTLKSKASLAPHLPGLPCCTPISTVFLQVVCHFRRGPSCPGFRLAPGASLPLYLCVCRPQRGDRAAAVDLTGLSPFPPGGMGNWTILGPQLPHGPALPCSPVQPGRPGDHVAQAGRRN